MNNNQRFSKTLNSVGIDLLTSRFISHFMRPLRDQVVPVFMLHRIADPCQGVRGHTLAEINRALDFVTSHGYQAISINHLIDCKLGLAKLPRRAVAFTLDDGFYDQGRFALPLFERRKLPVTTFLATDMMDGQAWPWECKLEFIIMQTRADRISAKIPPGLTVQEPIGDSKDRRRLIRAIRAHLKLQPVNVIASVLSDIADQLNVEVPVKAPPAFASITWAQARHLESDYVQFAPHSKQHIILSRLSDADAREEIVGSWEKMKLELNNPVPVFCYPNGHRETDFSTREQGYAREAGLLGAFSADPGYVDVSTRAQDDLFALRRFSFPSQTGVFKQYCSWLERGKSYLPRPTAKAFSNPRQLP